MCRKPHVRGDEPSLGEIQGTLASRKPHTRGDEPEMDELVQEYAK